MDYATIKYNSTGHQTWVARYNGPGNADDMADAMTIDKNGNIFVTGQSMGSANGTDYDFATIKYDKNGTQLWVARYTSPEEGENTALAIAVDNAGNVYVTGESPDTDNRYDYATVKYDSNGREVWVARYAGLGGSDEPCALMVDDSGNVYVTGTSQENNIGIDDSATIKYDDTGRQLWVARYINGTPFSMALDKTGNVYIAGCSNADGEDYLTIKYDNNGNQLWASSYDGMGNTGNIARGLAVDGAGNVYVTGQSPGGSNGVNDDYATVKYDSNGKELWVARYNGPANSDDEACGLAVDTSGNVYVAGSSVRASNGNRDYTTVKYNANGNELWVAQYAGSGNDDNFASAVGLDKSGNVYIIGQSGIDGSYMDYDTVKYNSDGKQLWAARYHGPGSGFDDASAIAIDGEGNVYVTGQSAGSNGIFQITQPPWTDVNVYSDTTQTIEVKVGEEFTFGFNTAPPLNLSWDEKHDDKMLSLVDSDEVSLQPNYPSNATTWFLYKALQPGETQVTFTYSSGEQLPVADQKVFVIDIQ
jgi:outer membrane protein assembly factor BamB